MTPAIRALSPDDVEGFRDLRLAALQDSPEAFASSYALERERPLALFAERLGQANDSLVVGAFLGGALVGMSGFYRDSHTKMRHRGHVWGMFVRPESRGQGLGRGLLDALVTHAASLDGLFQVNLEVVSSNTAALGLYESRGFERFGVERRALIVEGQALDEVLLVLALTPF